MSVVMLGRLSRGSLFDYALGVGPIAAGMLVVPTLACAAGREPREAWPQLIIGVQTLLSNFTHSPDSEAAGRWWTSLTCGLCHSDAARRDHRSPLWYTTPHHG